MLTIEVVVTDAELYKEDGGVPRYHTPGAVALDLRAVEGVVVRPGETIALRTGLAIHAGSAYGGEDARLDEMGIAALLIPRSGLGAKKGLVIGNLVGLIDEDFQGEIVVHAWNRNPVTNECNIAHAVSIQRGERLAQMFFLMVMKPRLKLVDQFSESTERGVGGFGSTGRT